MFSGPGNDVAQQDVKDAEAVTWWNLLAVALGRERDAVAAGSFRVSLSNQSSASKSEALQKASKAPPVVKPGANDPRVTKQIEHMNFRKAIKGAKTDSQKAELIGAKLAGRFGF